MRLYKQMILSIELVDYTERIVSEAFEKDEYKSVLKQKVQFPQVQKPIVIAVKMWQEFKKWLKIKNIPTTYDSYEYVES